MLFPSEEAVSVCQEGQLLLTCTINATILRWILPLQNEEGRVQTYSRYISTTDVSQQTSSWIVNSTSFLRVSCREMFPLVSRLLINPVTIALKGTKVNCTEVTNHSNADHDSAMTSTTINVIGEGCKNLTLHNNKFTYNHTYIVRVAYSNNHPEVITSVEYGTENATVYLELTPESRNIVSYTVSAEPQVVETLNSSLSSVQLTVPYNTLHNVSIMVSCGKYTTTTIIELHYGKSSFDINNYAQHNYFVAKCGYPLKALVNDSWMVRVMGYVDPSLEGMTVNFSCPTGHVLIGPSTATCTGNGEWESDPVESNIECKGES